MELLVAIAIGVVFTSVAWPTYSAFRTRAHKQVALEKMRLLGGALTTYIGQNAGALPAEDAIGTDSWEGVAKPESREAWYNSLPRLIGKKGAADFLSTPEAFYTDESLLFVPGANYPEKKKALRPLFALAFNTKLQRKDADGRKEPIKIEQIINPSRTVALLEQGLVNEKRTLAVQSRKDYDGNPKGSAKSFVGRYGGEGALCFVDGHVEFAKVGDTLTETGRFPFPQIDLIWTRTPEENPNRDENEVPRDSDKSAAHKKAK